MIHELKIAPNLYWAVRDGEKTAEVRVNDRDFAVGDEILLRPFDGAYLEGRVAVVVTHVLEGGQYGIEAGYCLLSFRRLSGKVRG